MGLLISYIGERFIAHLPAFAAQTGKPKLTYNRIVPTPFYHLSVACELLNHPEMPPQLQGMLHDQRGIFYFAKTAPDVQVISNQTREETHFYDIPITEKSAAWEDMWAAYPRLQDPKNLDPSQAVFVAGYICHLQADQKWLMEIVFPYFVDTEDGSFKNRHFIHDTLRSYLDAEALAAFPSDLRSCLEGVDPQDWVPFVEDDHFRDWRDYLTEQLHPGAEIKTIEVFAERQGISKQNFEALLRSDKRMQAEVFAYIPKEALQTFRDALMQANIDLLKTYFGEL